MCGDEGQESEAGDKEEEEEEEEEEANYDVIKVSDLQCAAWLQIFADAAFHVFDSSKSSWESMRVRLYIYAFFYLAIPLRQCPWEIQRLENQQSGGLRVD